MDSDDLNNIILYDGLCGLCDRSVQFIIRRDPQGRFRFAALQSQVGAGLMERHGLQPGDLNSVILIRDGQAFRRSAAALKVLKDLQTPLKIFAPLIVLPEWLRDFFYNLIAKNRYRLFGRYDQCMIPSPQVRERFLG